MRRRLLAAVALFAAAVSVSAADSKEAAAAKKGLQAVGEFVGTWNLEGKAKAGGKGWKEAATWGWKFKGEDSWIHIESKDGRFFTEGDLRYLPAKKQYQLTAKDKDGKEQVFAGELKKGKLVLERKDDKSGDVQRLTFNTLSEGVRMVAQLDVQSGGRGTFNAQLSAAGNKDGESFAGGAASKKPECVVTGGAASIPVTYMGKTYYVCCSGCRDEFNDNPKKYVDAFEKKK